MHDSSVCRFSVFSSVANYSWQLVRNFLGLKLQIRTSWQPGLAASFQLVSIRLVVAAFIEKNRSRCRCDISTASRVVNSSEVNSLKRDTGRLIDP